MNVDVTGWDKRNVWPLPSGQPAVRPSFKQVYAAATGRSLVGGFSLRNPRTDAMWHCLFDVASTGTPDCKMRIVDHNFVELQVLATNSAGVPRAVCCSPVEDQVLITSPDFASIWMLLGGAATRATKKASVNPNTTALQVPRGLSVSWAGRPVVAGPDALYIGDALQVRTFVAENTLSPPGGAIHGLHVAAGGALVVCTSTGVWALPEDAAASGQIVVGVFSKLTDYECVAYNTTAITHGRLFGLTTKGYRTIDEADSDETLLDEQVVSRTAPGGRLAFNDYRSGRLLGGAHGPIAVQGNFAHMTDLATGLRSWMHTADTAYPLAMVGLLQGNDGEELYITPTGICRMIGNTEVVNGVAVTATLAGRIITPPEVSPVLRHVTFESDTPATLACSVNGTVKTSSPRQVAPVVGTDWWDVGLTYREPPMRSQRFIWAERTDDVAVELQVVDHPARLGPSVDVEFKGPGKRRPG